MCVPGHSAKQTFICARSNRSRTDSGSSRDDLSEEHDPRPPTPVMCFSDPPKKLEIGFWRGSWMVACRMNTHRKEPAVMRRLHFCLVRRGPSPRPLGGGSGSRVGYFPQRGILGAVRTSQGTNRNAADASRPGPCTASLNGGKGATSAPEQTFTDCGEGTNPKRDARTNERTNEHGTRNPRPTPYRTQTQTHARTRPRGKPYSPFGRASPPLTPIK